MSIDDRIRKELEGEANDIDELLVDRQGMLELAGGAFKGGLGRWMVLVSVLIFLASAALVWTGYRFYVAETVDERVFWGVWFIISGSAQVNMKQWTWMEARRVSTLREIKRVEIAVDRLASAIRGKAGESDSTDTATS